MCKLKEGDGHFVGVMLFSTYSNIFQTLGVQIKANIALISMLVHALHHSLYKLY